jgi:hypothetical protein
MASRMSRSDMAGILQGHSHAGNIEIMPEKGLLYPAMQPDLYQLLLVRLRQQGISYDEAPALLRDLSNIIESSPGIDSTSASSKLQSLGWNGVTLDYQSLQLALAWIESKKP